MKKSKVILLPCNSYREEIVYNNLKTGLELLGGIQSFVDKEEVCSSETESSEKSRS